MYLGNSLLGCAKLFEKECTHSAFNSGRERAHSNHHPRRVRFFPDLLLFSSQRGSKVLLPQLLSKIEQS